MSNRPLNLEFIHALLNVSLGKAFFSFFDLRTITMIPLALFQCWYALSGPRLLRIRDVNGYGQSYVANNLEKVIAMLEVNKEMNKCSDVRLLFGVASNENVR